MKEIKADLFTVDDSYYLAHCISSDAKMGAGIAALFKERFDLSALQQAAAEGKLKVGNCVKAGRVLNLITKERYWEKPSYESFAVAVYNMKKLAEKHGIQKIAMPTIGAGLDRLSWTKNREIITHLFSDTDIEILVCRK